MKKYTAFYDLKKGTPCMLTVHAETMEQAIVFANEAVVNNGDYKRINKRGISVQLAN